MTRRKVQTLKKEVPRQGATVRLSDELDTGYGLLTGVSFLGKIGGGHHMASCVLDSFEIFPNDFEVEFLQTDDSVPPDLRFFSFPGDGFPAAGRKIEIVFKDGGQAPSYPYTLNIYLRLENPPK